MDAAAHYRQLVQLGRDEFLASAAPAALVRHRLDEPFTHSRTNVETLTFDQEIEETLPHGKDLPEEIDLEVFPLTKKPGASFPDRITIGRTANNDVAIPDTSVSRLHAYLRRDRKGWVVADAASKNGSWLAGRPLEPRAETPIASRTILKLGEVELTFYDALDLFKALGGS